MMLIKYTTTKHEVLESVGGQSSPRKIKIKNENSILLFPDSKAKKL